MQVLLWGQRCEGSQVLEQSRGCCKHIFIPWEQQGDSLCLGFALGCCSVFFSLGCWWWFMSPLERPPHLSQAWSRATIATMAPHCHSAAVSGVGRSSSPRSPGLPSQLQLLRFSDSYFLSLLSDADFLMLNDGLYVQATYIAGEEVWRQDELGM